MCACYVYVCAGVCVCARTCVGRIWGRQHGSPQQCACVSVDTGAAVHQQDSTSGPVPTPPQPLSALAPGQEDRWVGERVWSCNGRGYIMQTCHVIR